MKRFSLAAALLVFGGISMSTLSAKAQTINVPFSTAQAGGCTIISHDLIPLPVVPGLLSVDSTDAQTLTSDSGEGGESGKIGLICTQSFTATAAAAQQIPSTGSSQFTSEVGDTSVSSATSLAVGAIGVHVLDVDMTATTTDSVIAAGDYAFVVPVTIANN